MKTKQYFLIMLSIFSCALWAQNSDRQALKTENWAEQKAVLLIPYGDGIERGLTTALSHFFRPFTYSMRPLLCKFEDVENGSIYIRTVRQHYLCKSEYAYSSRHCFEAGETYFRSLTDEELELKRLAVNFDLSNYRTQIEQLLNDPEIPICPHWRRAAGK